jgi:hypothetical protein
MLKAMVPGPITAMTLRKLNFSGAGKSATFHGPSPPLGIFGASISPLLFKGSFLPDHGPHTPPLARTVVLIDYKKYKSLQRLSIPLWRLCIGTIWKITIIPCPKS